MSQVTITFSGIIYPFAGRIQVGLGVFPTQSVVWFLPQPTNIPSIGSLYVQSYGWMQLIDCLVDRVGVTINDGGQSLYAVVLDRRWRWKWRLISGRYNIRRTDGTIEPDTQKTPQELAGLLFAAMGEPSADVTALPNDGFPQVIWNYSRSNLELAQLCHSRGCDVSFNTLTNSFGIVRLGIGNPAVTGIDTESVSYSVDPPQAPDEILGLLDETLYQSMFELEAVGKDTDGTWQPIDDLSYAPADWAKETDIDHFSFLDEDPVAQALARATVYKAYRIKNFADGTLTITGRPLSLSAIAQALPLNRVMLDTYQDAMGVLRPKPYQISGIYVPDGDPPADVNVEDITIYDGGSSLNRAAGIVTFDRRMYMIENEEPQPAELYLTTSFGVRHLTTHEFDFGVVSYGPGGPNQMPFQIPELAFRHYVTWDVSGDVPTPTGYTDNRAVVTQEATSILAGIAAQFAVSSGSVVVYRSVVPIITDGVVRQVQYIANMGRGATTVAYNNYELAPTMPRRVDRENYAQARLTWEQIARNRAEQAMLRDNGLYREE